MKGLVDGKPMNKMLVDGGASINLMPYTTFHKLVNGPEDLIETDIMLKDFRGNTSNPFLGDQNMVDAGLFKGKTKVLTSTKSKEARTVDPKMQISADEYREIKRCCDEQKSQ